MEDQFCASCGGLLRAGFFCTHCGEPIEPPKKSKKTSKKKDVEVEETEEESPPEE